MTTTQAITRFRKTARVTAPTAPVIPEPIEIAKFWKNRKGDAIVVSLQSWEGFNIVQIRQHYSAPDGRLQPTKKGIALNVRHLPELQAAIEKAFVKVRSLGLLDEEHQANA